MSGVIFDPLLGQLRTSDSSAGTTSPLTTKGDIYGFSTVNARIPVGADGTILTADSTQTLGVKWNAVSGTGTVTSVTSATADATVANTTTTPVITVVSAPKLTTARTIGTITGDATSTGSPFDGTATNTNTLTLATVNSNVGSFTYGSFTVNGKGLITAAASGATPEVPLTFSTGLTRSVNTITVNTSQNISILSNLASNGLIKTSGGTGALSVATAGTDYQAPITLTTTGTSGAATFTSNTLNIPQYTGGGGSGTVNTGTLNALAYYASAGTAVSSTTNAVIAASGATLHMGTAGTIGGTLILDGVTSGSVTLKTVSVAGSNTMTLPAATDTFVGKATTDTLTNKTFDTAGTGNVLQINGTGITAITGTGSVVLAASPTLTGSPIAPTQTPADNSTKIATTAYVDNAVLGQNFKEAVGAATTTNLIGIYLNGSSGVGATFTYTATGVDVLDGVSLTLGMRVLLKNQTTDFQNGIYTVTTAGALGVAGILTRATDANQSGEWRTGDSTFVTAGTTQSATTWAYTGIDSPTMGSTSLTFAQTAGQGSFTAGSGISITGNSIALITPVTVALGGTNVTSASITAFNNITGYTASGATGTTSTNLVFSTSPTLITPSLGTPSALVGTNISGTGSSFTSGITQALASATTTVNVSSATAPSSGQVLTATSSTAATWQPASASLLPWTVVTGTSQSAAINNGYFTNNAGLVTVTLPTTIAVGQTVSVAGLGAGGWKIAQSASQLIHFGSSATTTGTGGSLASVNQYDAVTLVCSVANTIFHVINSQGNVTII